MDSRPSSARGFRPSVLAGAFAVALLLFWGLYSVVAPGTRPSRARPSLSFSGYRAEPRNSTTASPAAPSGGSCPDLRYDPPSPTFYDDPGLTYTIGRAVAGWDEKRRAWLDRHPSFKAGAGGRILMLSGSQPTPCRQPRGDHLLLRCLKNKMDYCRLHGVDFFYNTALLQPRMFSFWAKIPAVRAAMVAHPESEWIWWVDADAVFTDMEFRLLDNDA